MSEDKAVNTNMYGSQKMILKLEWMKGNFSRFYFEQGGRDRQRKFSEKWQKSVKNDKRVTILALISLFFICVCKL